MAAILSRSQCVKFYAQVYHVLEWTQYTPDLTFIIVPTIITNIP